MNEHNKLKNPRISKKKKLAPMSNQKEQSDPQKLAEQKLKLLSQQATLVTDHFLNKNNKNHTDMWIFSDNLRNSRDIINNPKQQGPQSLKKQREYIQSKTEETQQRNLSLNKIKIKNTRQSVMISNFNVKDWCQAESDIKQYMNINKQQQKHDGNSEILVEKKSLSLTNYMIYDKRLNSQKTRLTMMTNKQKEKLQKIKQMFQKRQKSYSEAKELRNSSDVSFQLQKQKNNKIHFPRRYKDCKDESFDNFNQKLKYQQKAKSKNGKDVSKFNQKVYLLSPVVNSQKAQLHNHFQKYLC